MTSVTEDYDDTVASVNNSESYEDTSVSQIGNNIKYKYDELKSQGQQLYENNKENIDAINSSISDKLKEGQESISNASSKIKEKFKPLFDFMDSNSLVAKFSFLLIVIFAFIILLGFIVNIISYFLENNRHQKIINGMIDASSTTLVIPQDPSVSGAKTIYRSINQLAGIEFTWSVWIYINSISNNSTYEYQHIFSKGNYGPKTLGINDPNNAPGLYINTSNKNELTVIMDTYSNPYNVIDVPNIPMNKWVNVMMICHNTTIDVYINGVITKSGELNGIPKQNYGDVYVALNNGFDGYISNLWYYSYALGTVAIEDLVKRGPNTKMTGNNQGLNEKQMDYLSLRWYFDETQHKM